MKDYHFIKVSLISLLLLGGHVNAEESLEVHPFPKVGPIIRNVTTDRIDFMGQGRRGEDGQGIFRYAKMLDDGELDIFSDPQTFIMPDADYKVGRSALEFLDPDSTYCLQVGYLQHRGDLPRNINWGRAHQLTVTTHPISAGNQFSFLTGSCRRLEEILGFPLWAKKGDKTFAAMVQNIKMANANGEKTNFITFTGDQIYGDATPFNRCKTFDDFARRYELAFSQPHIRALMASGIPTYMITDDHEWKDNFTKEQEKDHPSEYAAAIKSYSLFQRPQGQATPYWWYTTEGDVNAFFMDVRNERKPSKKQMISDEQMTAVQTWLSRPDQQDRIKILVSAVPMFLQEDEDAWSGYKDQLGELVTYIINNHIKYVMVLSGDAHCENEGMFTIYDQADTKQSHILEVLVSGFYAIFGTHGVHMDDQVDLSDHGYTLKVEGGLPPIINKNVFARIRGDHRQKTISVRAYDRKNNLLRDALYDLEEGKKIS